MREFTETEQKILALAGDHLPDSATPYADMARMAGCAEQEVLDLISSLKEEGVIRRFGATLRHQKAGYGHNAMVAWKVEEDKDIMELGRLMASVPEISHCYTRRTYPDWEYNLYTMIHGKKPGDCLEMAGKLSKETGVADFCVLNSIKELKKTSMRYFRVEDYDYLP